VSQKYPGTQSVSSEQTEFVTPVPACFSQELSPHSSAEQPNPAGQATRGAVGLWGETGSHISAQTDTPVIESPFAQEVCRQPWIPSTMGQSESYSQYLEQISPKHPKPPVQATALLQSAPLPNLLSAVQVRPTDSVSG